MREQKKLNQKKWYERILQVIPLLPLERYNALIPLHEEAIKNHITNIEVITEEESVKKIHGVQRKLVVAHIMSWEEWAIQVLEDKHKKMRLLEYMRLENYLDPDHHKSLDFESPNHFNEYQRKKYAELPWIEVKSKAKDIAMRLKSFFPSEPTVDLIDFMEESFLHRWQSADLVTVEIPSGWYLWISAIEHEEVKHVAELTHYIT